MEINCVFLDISVLNRFVHHLQTFIYFFSEYLYMCVRENIYVCAYMCAFVHDGVCRALISH